MKKISDLKEYLSKINSGEEVYNFLCAVDRNDLGVRNFEDGVYVNVVMYNTSNEFEGVFESHRKYVDLHVLVQGQEKLFYCDRESRKIVKEYDEQEDYALYKSTNYSFIEYQKGQAIECNVNEPHMAAGAVDNAQTVLKAIVKIPIK